MVDLTISIGTLDNYKVLEPCLRSIYQEDDPQLSYKVFVVNNGFTESRVSEKIEKNFPQVTLVKKKPKLGYCVPHNLVMSISNSRYVLILDDDTIVMKGTLKKMVAFMDSHPEVGIAGCKTLNPDGTFQKTYGLMPDLKNQLLNAFKISNSYPDRLFKDISFSREVEYILGAFMFVRAEILKEVGLLDENYYTLGCEPDWCYRIRKAGWKVMFVPEAEIIHIGGEHSFNATSRSVINLIRHHVHYYYFFHKHYGRFSCFLLRPIMIIGMLLRIFHYSWVYILRPANRVEAGKRVRAFWRVLRFSFSFKPYNMPKELQ